MKLWKSLFKRVSLYIKKRNEITLEKVTGNYSLRYLVQHRCPTILVSTKLKQIFADLKFVQKHVPYLKLTKNELIVTTNTVYLRGQDIGKYTLVFNFIKERHMRCHQLCDNGESYNIFGAPHIHLSSVTSDNIKKDDIHQHPHLLNSHSRKSVRVCSGTAEKSFKKALGNLNLKEFIFSFYSFLSTANDDSNYITPRIFLEKVVNAL